MKKKKGFSLVELLGVVIILAILAFIVIPVIGNLIRLARIRSAVASAYGYVEATNNEIVMKNTRGEDVANTNYDVVANILKVKYKGKGPSTGWYSVDKVRVQEGEFCINGFDIKYEKGRAEYDKDLEICPQPPKDIEFSKLCDGTKQIEAEKTYTISTIEELACFSKLVNAGNTFEETTIKLTKDLDFNDDKSYKNANALTEDVNGNGTVETIKTELTTSKGFNPIGNNTNQFKGEFDGNEYTINNLLINRNTRYVGLFGDNYGIIQNLTISNFNVTGGEIQTAVLTGANNGIVKGINIKKGKVSGASNIGGIAGGNFTTIIGCNVDEITAQGTTKIGGIVGHNAGLIRDVVARGTLKGGTSVGGDYGSKQHCYTYNTLVNMNVTGTYSVGGLIGYTDYTANDSANATAYAIVEGGTVKATSSNAGKAVGYISSYTYKGAIYTSSGVTLSGSGGKNGTNYNSSNNNNLTYYSGLKYDTTKPILETRSTGDVNNSGYYFDYNDNGVIIIIPVGSATSTPEPEVCTEEPCYPHDEDLSISSGDNPPTCTIHYIVPVTNGIKVNFSCTDDNSVPKVRSEFNAVRPTAPKNFEDFTGIYKTGTVSGYTRNITATWDTNNSISIPSRSECYYYRYAAEDKDGNWSSYVTNDCYCGFDNSCK